jgi:hypothetical protein
VLLDLREHRDQVERLVRLGLPVPAARQEHLDPRGPREAAVQLAQLVQLDPPALPGLLAKLGVADPLVDSAPREAAERLE